jgi:hypothetical protein
MDFKYHTKFDVSIRQCKIGENSFISTASLENLKNLLPSQSIDLGKNIDLMGVAFDAAVVNQFNRNDDGIDSETAVQIAPYFIHKPTNIEHNKKQIVGHIVSAGFNSWGANVPMTNQEVIETNDLVNLALGAVIYKLVDPKFTDLIYKSTSESSNLFNTVSASWELGFNEYVLAVGGPNIRDAEIISNPKHIDELKGKLRAYGGNGKMDDGSKIYRLVKGAVYPLGIGFTSNPAANVKGLLLDNGELQKEEVSFKDPRDKKVFAMNTKNISQFKIKDVNTTKSMDLETFLSELKASLTEKKFSEEAIAGMTSTFADAIRQKDEEYRVAKTEKEASETKAKELLASVETLQKELADTKVKLQEIEAAQEAEKALARFNARMEQIDSLYALEDEDRKVIASELQAIEASDEAFATYQEKLAIVLKHKNKEYLGRLAEETEAKIAAEVEKRLVELNKSTASAKTEAELAEEALEKAKASAADKTIPNNNGETSKENKSLKEKFASAFSRENILIS